MLSLSFPGVSFICIIEMLIIRFLQKRGQDVIAQFDEIGESTEEEKQKKWEKAYSVIIITKFVSIMNIGIIFIKNVVLVLFLYFFNSNHYNSGWLFISDTVSFMNFLQDVLIVLSLVSDFFIFVISMKNIKLIADAENETNS